MLKKIIALIIAASASVMMFSCGNKTEDTEETNKPEKEPTVQTGSDNDGIESGAEDYEEEEIIITTDDLDEEDTVSDEAAMEDIVNYIEQLPDKNFNGYNFRLLVRKGQSGSQYFDEPPADIVDAAIYARNQQIEDRYNINFVVNESSSNDFETDGLNSILAGDDAYDLIFAHSRAAFVYALQGAAYNVHDIDAINLERPWWYKNISNDCTVNGKMYVLDGDFQVTNLSATMCLLFNKSIFDELGYDYPYEMVRDGDWTFDEFAYLVKKGGKDLNGDGTISYETDQVGFISGYYSAPINIIYPGGQKIYRSTDDGGLELSLYSNKTVEIFDEFFSLMSNDACSYEGGLDPFAEGRAMFYAGSLGDAKTLRNMDSDFGFLPYPKFDDDDEYATVINGWAPLGIIPITVSDVERTGTIIEAMAAYGAKDVVPAFYDRALKTKYSRDDDSEEMMDIIKNSITFDLGYLAGGSLQLKGYDLAHSSNPDFASYYASRKNAAQKEVESFMEAYGGMTN